MSRNLTIKIFCKNISIGDGFNYRKGFLINVHPKAKLKIGENVFFNNNCSINVQQNVTIGNNCIFGEGVKIYDHNHIFNDSGIPFYKQGFSCKSVIIGSNCWVGSNVIILPGVVVGDNTVIGAGCVVSSSIPSDVIVKQNRSLDIVYIKYKKGDSNDKNSSNC